MLMGEFHIKYLIECVKCILLFLLLLPLNLFNSFGIVWEALIAAITDAGQEVDEDVVSKLTGKAAQYFTTVLTSVAN